jgi:hypothetical protein
MYGLKPVPFIESVFSLPVQPLGMARPKRNAGKDQILSPSRTFFATTKTSMGRALLQSERNATLWIDWLRSAQNPVKAGWVDSPEKFPAASPIWQNESQQGANRLRKNSGLGRKDVPQGLKPDVFSIIYGTTKVVP